MIASRCKVALIVPTLNFSQIAEKWARAVSAQSYPLEKVLIIDSESNDGTVSIMKKFNFEVKSIKRSDFNHGKTRQMGVELIGAVDIIVFLTQDALFADQFSLEMLVRCFYDEEIGCAYGRQLPRKDANEIAAHARLFNYPNKSEVKSIKDAKRLGVKTTFISNSFAAYRRAALLEIGGFPENAILSEDTYVAAKMLLKGWKIAYAAEAKVYHSHNYTIWQEFRRYFDIGVFHAKEFWIRENFGEAEGEGLRFVKSEAMFLKSKRPLLLFSAALRNGMKFLGYKLGCKEEKIPLWMKIYLTMNRIYWRK